MRRSRPFLLFQSSTEIIEGLPRLSGCAIRLEQAQGAEIKVVTTQVDKKAMRSDISLMGMSFLNMSGFGNPSNDSILTDFAFGHSLIVLSTILIGRKTAFIWFMIVVGTLFYVTNRHGWDYQFNYLTPKESINYQNAIKKREKWALVRRNYSGSYAD